SACRAADSSSGNREAGVAGPTGASAAGAVGAAGGVDAADAGGMSVAVDIGSPSGGTARVIERVCGRGVTGGARRAAPPAGAPRRLDQPGPAIEGASLMHGRVIHKARNPRTKAFPALHR